MSTRIPPGPKGHHLLGNLPEFRRDPLAFFTRCARDYGDIVHLRMANAHVYLLNNPEYVESVLVTNSRNFVKGKVVQANRRLLGNGLLTSEGDAWLRQRRLVQPAFHRDRVAGYGARMLAITDQMLERWRADQPSVLDIHHEMMQLTQRIATGTLFNVDVAGDLEHVSAMLSTVWQHFTRRIESGLLIPEFLPTPGNLRLRNAIYQLDEVIYRIIDAHQSNVQGSDDVLSALLRGIADEPGAAQASNTHRQLRDEVLTLFVAGHETTAQALSWTWYLLALHPQVEQKLLAELQRILHSRPPTAADVPRLPYTEWVVLEAMRLYPPVWGIPRVALRQCEIGGYAIPAGASVTMSQWVMHRDSRFFVQPEAFLPERWEPGQVQSIPRFAYFPFGGGPRQCIGGSFAMLEAVLLVAAIAQQYHFELAPGQAIVPAPSITLYPRDGIKVMLARR